jgi:hypothetical protein
LHGTAGPEKREALKIEERTKAQAKAENSDAKNSNKLTFNIPIGRYWAEHGEYQTNAAARESLPRIKQHPVLLFAASSDVFGDVS